ncbi:MAG: hypothetical protein ABSF61_08275 [Anaerolineales bacterium]|jgi:hypothetical protein
MGLTVLLGALLGTLVLVAAGKLVNPSDQRLAEIPMEEDPREKG